MSPRHKPTDDSRAKVAALIAFGIPEDAIATYIGISPMTLRKWYRREIDTGALDANAKVAGTLFNLAISGNVVACIFWAKTRMKWTERLPEAAPPPPPDPAALTMLNQGDRDELRAILERRLPRPAEQLASIKSDPEVIR